MARAVATGGRRLRLRQAFRWAAGPPSLTGGPSCGGGTPPGFLAFAIGEGVLLSGTAAGSSASVSAFAAGTALWAAALALISGPRQLPSWLRVLGATAAGLFAVTAARIYSGAALSPTSSPLPFFAYPVLVATLLGWAWMLVREEQARHA